MSDGADILVAARGRERREPVPLYALLRHYGYRYQSRPLDDGAYERLITGGEGP